MHTSRHGVLNIMISIIDHTPMSTIRAVISILLLVRVWPEQE